MLIVHKPTALLDDIATDRVLSAFREYCSNRGYLMDPNEPKIKRRKRTIVYTAKNEQSAAWAEKIFEANEGHLIPLDFLNGLSLEDKIAKLEGTFTVGLTKAGSSAKQAQRLAQQQALAASKATTEQVEEGVRTLGEGLGELFGGTKATMATITASPTVTREASAAVEPGEGPKGQPGEAGAPASSGGGGGGGGAAAAAPAKKTRGTPGKALVPGRKKKGPAETRGSEQDGAPPQLVTPGKPGAGRGAAPALPAKDTLKAQGRLSMLDSKGLFSRKSNAEPVVAEDV